MPGTITPIGVGTATLYPKLTTAGSGFNMLVAPGNTNAPIIFEPPAGLSGGDLEVWLIASGGANWGGCQLWVSSDGNTYALAGTIYRGARQGVLTATLPSHADPDTADTLSVDLTESQGQLLSGTMADADNLVTLCYCDGELFSYQTATLIASYKYDLTYLRRGIYGTPIGGHSSGANFARFGPNDPSLFRYRYPSSFISQTIHVKLPAFNTFGQALQSLAGLTPTSYTLTGGGAVQGGFIFPDSDRRLLTPGDLQRLSKNDLRIARNEIFARRGRYFESADLKARFERFSWYAPNTWNPKLNPIEQANVELIDQAGKR